jgi:hypothetical protein
MTCTNSVIDRSSPATGGPKSRPTGGAVDAWQENTDVRHTAPFVPWHRLDIRSAAVPVAHTLSQLSDAARTFHLPRCALRSNLPSAVPLQADGRLPESRQASMRRIAVLSLALALAACGGDSTSPPPSFTGTWTADAIDGGTAFTVTVITVEQNAGQITGTGSFTVGDAGGIALTVTGTHVYPQVSLTLKASGFQDSNITGTFLDRNTVQARLNGSGFANTPMMLQR